MIGQIVANYRVISIIGEGGMGVVYMAEHVHFIRKVAIKSLHKKLLANLNIKERFRNEAATLSQIEHPNIVKLYDYLETDDGFYLIMEYVEGIPLDEFIKNESGPINENNALAIFSALLNGFSFAHKKKIVHRDVKPSNITISRDFKTVKILDFGIAKIMGEASKNLTKDGTQMGTVYYMSPEQVNGIPTDHRSDIYSLGITLFQMITGLNPYESLTTEFEIYNQIIHAELPDAGKVYPHVSKKTEYVIKKATQKNPSDRYQSCEEMQADLDIERIEESKINFLSKNAIPTTVLVEEIITNKKRFIPVAFSFSILIIVILAVLSFKGVINIFGRNSDNSMAENPTPLLISVAKDSIPIQTPIAARVDIVPNYQNNLFTRYRVTPTRSYFHYSSNPSTEKNSYLVEGEMIEGCCIENGFVYTKYSNNRSENSTGWINVADLGIITSLVSTDTLVQPRTIPENNEIQMNAYLIYDNGSLSDFNLIDNPTLDLQNTVTGDGSAERPAEKIKLIVYGERISVNVSGDEIIRVVETYTNENRKEITVEGTGCNPLKITVARNGEVVITKIIPFKCN